MCARCATACRALEILAIMAGCPGRRPVPALRGRRDLVPRVRMTPMGQTLLRIRRLAVLAILFAMLFAMPALGQSISLKPSEALGPPSPAEVQTSRVEQARKLVGDLGMSAGALSTGEKRGDPDALAMPDITQTIPTTTEPKKLSSSLQILLLLSVLTLAPSILLMTTCFTRIVIVMSLLRQAIGAAQLPPNQILIGLSLFMTFLVMGPTWSRVNTEAITPYSNSEITQMDAFGRATGIMREFMIKQIKGAHNEDDVFLFHSYAHPGDAPPEKWEDVET